MTYRRTEDQTVFEVMLQAAETPGDELSPDPLPAATADADAAASMPIDDAPDEADTADVLEVRATNGNSSLEPVDDNQLSTRPGLSDLTLSDGIRRALEAEGLSSIDDLLSLSEQELLDIKGIGSSSVKAIRRSLTSHSA